MDPRTASPSTPDPDATAFVRFCYRRRRVGWPELYDEMCAVASRGLFRGLGPDDLAAFGIGFSLFDMPALASLAATVVAEEQARRRPVAVAIIVDAPAEPSGDAEPVEPGEIVDVAPDAIAAASDAHVEPSSVADPPAERVIDVPIRLATSPAGA
jgi:hypothetical protein